MVCLSRTTESPAFHSAALFSDPILSCNVYCAGRLSEVVHRVVAPCWSELRTALPVPEGHLWVMRYSRCGEHLKVRLHGPGSLASKLREILEPALEDYFAVLGPPPADGERKSRPLATPIDREDQLTTDYPDRTFLWTTYERSHISLGYRPYVDDDVHVALLTRCLARGTEILFRRVETDSRGQWSHSKAQSTLLNGLIAGLASLPFTPRERSLYLLYHRDCLLRAALKDSMKGGGPAKMARTLSSFRDQVTRMGDGVQRLGGRAQSCWAQGSFGGDADLEAWSAALRELTDYLVPICGGRVHAIDPFAENPLFFPVLKVLHGFSNQLGLNHLNEAFALHLLLSGTTEDGLRDRPVLLRPAPPSIRPVLS